LKTELEKYDVQIFNVLRILKKKPWIFYEIYIRKLFAYLSGHGTHLKSKLEKSDIQIFNVLKIVNKQYGVIHRTIFSIFLDNFFYCPVFE
jgi:hypothetical protein